MPFRLKDHKRTVPGGFDWVDPLTMFAINARSHANWLSMATDHRVANALPLPEPAEMEDQLCSRMPEKTRREYCQEYQDDGLPKPLLGVGSTLKKMLAEKGIHACWSCTRMADKMDSWGPDGCETHLGEIVEVMEENANAHKWMRYLPFKEMGATALVRLAIHKVRNHDL